MFSRMKNGGVLADAGARQASDLCFLLCTGFSPEYFENDNTLKSDARI